MRSAASTHQSVLVARRRFFANGEAPTELVRPSILRSWMRCAERGFDGEAVPLAEPLTAHEFSVAIDQHERLCRLSRPELELLHADAEASGALVVLTDPSGLVLDARGSSAFAGRAARVMLRPGVPWGETASGTNAVGTALVERQAIAVHGAEHFFACHQVLTCAAGPIFGPRGEILGGLDLSGPAAVPGTHALGLVQLAIDQIEHRLFEAGFDGREVLRCHTDAGLLGTAREAILVFEGGWLVAANRHALRLTGLGWEAVGQVEAASLFAEGWPPEPGPWRLRLRSGEVLHGRLDHPGARPARPSPSPEARGEMPAREAGVPVSGAERAVEPLFDPATAEMLRRAVRLLDAGVPVLVQGETGTGKDVFARAAHAASARAGRPFVAVNCAALPESLIESELFGYDEGAFTGARRHGAPGLLRAADGGVLFLDEIGDMALSLQTRLLRVLQERVVVPVGGRRPIPVDFTLICATNRTLSEQVARGAFRSDLYFRIATYTVPLPPLRALAEREAIIRMLWARLGGAAVSLAPDCLAALARHDWPGNFRQLTGTLRTMIVLAEPGHVCTLADLSPELRGVAAPPERSGAADLEALTREAMQAALVAAGGNVAAAARRLGINRSTLYRRGLGGRPVAPPLDPARALRPQTPNT